MVKVPETAKDDLTRKANALVDSYFRPNFVKPPPLVGLRFNYVVDVYTKWFGEYLYFCAKYQAPARDAANPATTFEHKFARVRYIDRSRVGLAFARPSGAWMELFSPIPLEECFKILQEDSHFEP